MWKSSLQNKIKGQRKNLSQLELSKDNEASNVRHWQTFKKNTELE